MKKTIECLNAIDMTALESPISQNTEKQINAFLRQYAYDTNTLPKVGFDANLNASRLLCALYEATELNGKVCEGLAEKIDRITSFLPDEIMSGSVGHSLSELHAAVNTVNNASKYKMEKEINEFKGELQKYNEEANRKKIASELITELGRNNQACLNKLNLIIDKEFAKIDKTQQSRYQENGEPSLRLLSGAINAAVSIKLRQACASYMAVEELQTIVKQEGSATQRLQAYQAKFNEPKISKSLQTNADSVVKQFFQKVKNILVSALTLGLLPPAPSGSNQQVLAKQAVATLREAEKEGLLQKPSSPSS